MMMMVMMMMMICRDFRMGGFLLELLLMTEVEFTINERGTRNGTLQRSMCVCLVVVWVLYVPRSIRFESVDKNKGDSGDQKMEGG